MVTRLCSLRPVFYAWMLLLLQLISIDVLKATAKTFDFYYFVQEWPGSYCDTHRKCCFPKIGIPSSDFHIHGLWPNMEDGSWPQYCSPHSHFDFSQVADLEGELEKEWASLQCPSNNGHKFWAHEWERHGSCALNLKEHDYFNSTLALKKQMDILGVLEATGILPNGEEYSSDEILETIGEAIGAVPEIRCNRDLEGREQLLDVFVCINKYDASTVIPCPTEPHNRCSPKIIFPPFRMGLSSS
ncbi:hypothetical protein SUGI_0501560 [Cryptomeria japonica]|uniref:ribonuclease 3 n=1 Tax=Cryptomeria japonica TaxID=3369 RepID=UPI002408E5EB|nr:ribonuclease 3 [Cryptomeria japonica]GLJ26157.1 hypothetical protein SUGI_0501560 [Cryptomeria japonica]